MKKCFLLVFLFPLITYSQYGDLDSLKKAIKTDAEDTSKVKKLNFIAWETRNNGNFDEAASYAEKALVISKKLNYRWGIMNSYNSLGLINGYRGNYPQALSDFLASLKMADEMREPFHKANVLSNLGNLYYFQEELKKALEYQNLALEIRMKLLAKGRNRKTLSALANSLGNIGIIYDNLKQIDTARSYHRRSLVLMRECGNRIGEANALNNIASCFLAEDSLGQALNEFNAALEIYRQVQYRSGEATCLGNLSDVYYKMKKYDRAEASALESMKISREIGELDGVKEASQSLYMIYEATGKHAPSLQYYKQYIRVRDSLQNEENTKRTVRVEMQFEFDKRTAAEKLLQEKKEVLAKAEARRQKIILFAISGFGLLVLGFAIFAYRSFLHKKKANIEISLQKRIIEEKQKEILDSIHYAKRIQKSLMSNESVIQKNLNRLNEHGRS